MSVEQTEVVSGPTSGGNASGAGASTVSERRPRSLLVMTANVAVSALLPFLGLRQFYLAGDSISR